MNRPQQLYRWFFIASQLGAFKSIWLTYNGCAITATGSGEMEIAG